MQTLYRRGFNLGAISDTSSSKSDPIENWQLGKPVVISDAINPEIPSFASQIEETELLVTAILEGQDCTELFSQPPYQERIESQFLPLGSASNEGDDQEIDMLLYDQQIHPEIVLEDLWMKVSWLSFYEEDASLRFRFSFGVDLEEDVSADADRQLAAAELAEVVFPESKLVSSNKRLIRQIADVTGIKAPTFVERILYFNAPGGGAYLHHDMERGHAGVVYAQVSGKTFWLALPQSELIHEIQLFIEHDVPKLTHLSDTQKSELATLASDPERLEMALTSFNHDLLISLINESPQFISHLVTAGHSRILSAGDVILLPQIDQSSCCWHTVFCLGDEVGQALSFAIK